MEARLLAALFLASFCYGIHDAQYECGSHGRFEYCIDGISGCVIGCHCHPGYYFDTDSKICEPNTKLSQDYRRHYISEPTRIQVPYLSERNGITSNPNTIDDKIDEITKDTSDLGDWLYNQFFKTIENQVMNKTDENEPKLTRRSGSIPVKKKPKKKQSKHPRKTNKKLKKKKSGFKKKLLRITEDDSLFDSSSTSSDESTYSSSDSNSGDTSSENKKNKNHGHKKFLIYNKRPKPSLPSFIFLPNMDTPFYPPIGIPPPPALPMYPMVPVPPMGPVFPYTPGTTPDCDSEPTVRNEKSTKGITSSSEPASQSKIETTPKTLQTTTETTAMIATQSTPDETTPEEQDTSRGKEKMVRSKHNKHQEVHSKKKKLFKERTNDGTKINLLQAIKQKLKRRNKVVPINQFIDNQNNAETFFDNSYLQNPAPFIKTQPEILDYDTPMEDVDFKYITELIHRPNKTERKLKSASNDVYLGVPRPSTDRRSNFYNADNSLQSKNLRNEHKLIRVPHKSEDTYYTNLGRQIAAMIRKIDTQGQRQLNIEIEQSTPSSTSHPFFDENIHSHRSYWDRLIRSTEKKYYPLYFTETGYLKDSNENLITVENKVKFAINTILPLSLAELENFIYKMQNTHNQTNTLKEELKLKKTRLQFSSKLFKKTISTQEPDYRTYNKINISKSRNYSNKLNAKMYNELLNNFMNILPLGEDSIRNITTVPNTLYIAPTRKYYNNSAFKIPLVKHLQFLNTIKDTHPKPSVKIFNKPFHINPLKLHHKHLNYYPEVINQNLHQKARYQIPVMDNRRINHEPQDKPLKASYFHHELNSFNYFDK